MGSALLSRLGFQKDAFGSARGRAGLDLALGMGLWGLFYFPLSAVPWLWGAFGQSVSIFLMVIAIAKWHRHLEDILLALKHWREERRQQSRGMSFHTLLGFLLFILFLLAFINACGPARSWDELVDHLPRARIIAEQGTFTAGDISPFSGYPALCELLFAPQVRLTAELPAVTVFLFALSLLLMITGYARAYLPPGYANPAAIIFFSMPLVSDLMRSALVDMPLAAFCFGAFYLISAVLSDKRDTKVREVWYFVAAGIFLGLAMSVKYNGLLIAACWLLILPITLLKKRVGFMRVLGWIFAMFIPALIVSGGWFVRNYIFYGNPIYPFFQNLLGASGSSLTLEAFTRPERGNSIPDLLLYPLRLTFDYQLVRHWYSAITPAFLCFIPLGFILRGDKQFRPIFIMAFWLGILNLIFAYFLSPGQTRYLLPLWAIWAPAATYGLARASAGSRLIKGLIVPAILIAPMLFMIFLQGKTTSELFPYFAGRETKSDVIARDMPSINLIDTMGEFIPPTGKLLSIEPRVYYMSAGTVIGTPGIEAPAAPDWGDDNTAAIVADMQWKGYTHLFIDFSSRQIKHAMGMDFFLATIPPEKDGRYYSYDGIKEEMEQRYGIGEYFMREDLYELSAIGGFDVYTDSSGRDWHWVDRATIEERSKYSQNLKFIRHFWLMEETVLKEVARDGSAVLYEIDYKGLKILRSRFRGYRGGRLKDINHNPSLTPQIQQPDENDLTLLKKQDGTGMI